MTIYTINNVVYISSLGGSLLSSNINTHNSLNTNIMCSDQTYSHSPWVSIQFDSNS